MNMLEVEKEITDQTCCLCLDEDGSTFHANSTIKSLPLHEMVSFCIGIKVRNQHIFDLVKQNNQ